jgi:hypothetical protein
MGGEDHTHDVSVRRGVHGRGICAILVSGRRIDEGPDKFLERTPGLLQSRTYKARLQCLYACNSWRCLVPRAGFMKAGEKSYRLYSCRRCAKQVRICVGCDRGNLYCAEGCAKIRRRESVRRAGHVYQKSRRGASKHAARQCAWRERQLKKVTHQASLACPVELKVVPCSITPLAQEPHDETNRFNIPPITMGYSEPHWPMHHPEHTTPRCCFCGCVLTQFARLGPLRSGP